MPLDQIESTLRTSANVTVPFPDATSAKRLDLYRALAQVNHPPTGVALSNTSIDENTNTSAGFEVGTLSAIDADTCDKHAYSKVGGADAASFSIGGANNDRLILTAGMLNFEAKPGYSVIIRVTDAFGAVFDQTLTVTVNDVDEPPTGSPSITGTRTVGQRLTANTIPVVNPDAWAISTYQWRRTGVDIAGANASTYLLVSDDYREYMRVCVTYTSGVSSPPPLCSGTDTVAVGDPHITTVDGLHYDFQGAGEFVALRGAGGMEIQARHTPVSTASAITDGYSGLASGVSINTAVAARVGSHRVTLQPNLSGNPASGGLELRIDGVVTALPADGLDLGSGGRLAPVAGGAMQVDFPDQTTMIVTPGWWPAHQVWYLNVSVLHTSAYEGLMGARAHGSWLPRLSDGKSLGPMPAALPDRYRDLYVTFADSWRVTSKTSLFDYAPDTSTDTFTLKDWPKQKPPFIAPHGLVAEPVERPVAVRACRDIEGRNDKADCVFDVMVTGYTGFAETYLRSQKIRAGLTSIMVRDDKDPSRPKEAVTFTATVARHATITRPGPDGKGALAVPAGAVQFMLDGSKAGGPIKLDPRGQARWQVSNLEVGKHRIAARYLPAKGSAFLASSSLDEPHSVEEGKPRERAPRPGLPEKK